MMHCGALSAAAPMLLAPELEREPAIVAMLIGVGAVLAGARASSGAGDIGVAAMSAPQSVIQRTLLSYVRAQEEQADKAGVKFLTMTQQSPKGMYETFKRFADKIEFQSKYIDPYLQTHPMPKERMDALAEIAKTSPYWDKKDPPELQSPLAARIRERGEPANCIVPREWTAGDEEARIDA
jgi:predicted Zn-dependent protease